MTDTAAAALRELSEPWSRGDRVKAAIQRAARRAGLSYWRAFDIWYGKARRIEQHERDLITEALDRRRMEVARNEFHELRIRLAKLEARLLAQDADFHGATVDRLREQIGRPGGKDRVRDRRE